MALTELARYLPRHETRNRFLRQGTRLQEHETLQESPLSQDNEAESGAGFDIPAADVFQGAENGGTNSQQGNA
jgi:putative (di)nucleoside polyphosphate hydrolase